MDNSNLSTLHKLTGYEGLCAYLCGGFNSNHGSHELQAWPLLNQKNSIQHDVRVRTTINKVNKPNYLITYHMSPNYFHNRGFRTMSILLISNLHKSLVRQSQNHIISMHFINNVVFPCYSDFLVLKTIG